MPLCLQESRFPNVGLFRIEDARLSKYMSSCFVGTKGTAVLLTHENGSAPRPWAGDVVIQACTVIGQACFFL